MDTSIYSILPSKVKISLFYLNGQPRVCYKRKYVHRILVNGLVKLAQAKTCNRLADRLRAVDWDVKPQVNQIRKYDHPTFKKGEFALRAVSQILVYLILNLDSNIISMIRPVRWNLHT